MIRTAVLNHPMFIELKANVRLQWLLLLVAVILCLSGIKAFSDVNAAKAQSIQQQLALLQRLENAMQQPLSQEQLTQADETLAKLLAQVPSSQSSSVAEATALAKVDNIANGRITRGRANLVGSDEIVVGDNKFWQVRVEYRGQLNQHDLFALLSLVDGADVTSRLVSFQYRPNQRGNISMVLDFMFRPEDNR